MADPAAATPVERLPLGYSAADAQRPLTWVVRIFAGGALAASILSLIGTIGQITTLMVMATLNVPDNIAGLAMQIVQGLAAGALLIAALGLLKMRRGSRRLAIGASIAMLAVAVIDCLWVLYRNSSTMAPTPAASSYDPRITAAAFTAFWISERASTVLYLFVLIWFLTRPPVRQIFEGNGEITSPKEP